MGSRPGPQFQRMAQVGGFWGDLQALEKLWWRQIPRGWPGARPVLTTSGGCEGHRLRCLFRARRSHKLYGCQPGDVPREGPPLTPTLCLDAKYEYKVWSPTWSMPSPPLQANPPARDEFPVGSGGLGGFPGHGVWAAAGREDLGGTWADFLFQ